MAFVVACAALEHLGVGLRSLVLGCLWLRARGFGAFRCRLRNIGLGHGWLRARVFY